MTPELMTHDPITHEDHRSSQEIESEIRKTRGRMDSTLDELGHRLTARALVNSALDWWDAPDTGNQGSTAVRKAAVTLAKQVRQHPMPSLLIGAGVAWLISESVEHKHSTNGTSRRHDINTDSNGDSGGAGEWVGNKVDEAKEAASSAIGNVREKSQQLGAKLHDAKDRLGEQAHVALDRSKSAAIHVGQDLKEGYHVAGEKFTKTCDEYPLAVGVAFAALGALAGLFIPATRREDELMGEKSDVLVEQTKEKASSLLETGKEVGTKVLDIVKEQAREQGLTASGVSEALTDLRERSSQVLQQAKDEAIHTAEQKGIKLPAEYPTDDTEDAVADDLSQNFSDGLPKSEPDYITEEISEDAAPGKKEVVRLEPALTNRR